MATINIIKEQNVTETPLLLFDCELSTGAVERWSTHSVNVGGHQYAARVLKQNIYQMQSGSGQGVDVIAQISVTLANADSYCSEIEQNTGWKGSTVTVRFLFFDFIQGAPASDIAVLLVGLADAPDQITESTLRLTVNNSLNLQRVQIPGVRIQRRCPWDFPATVVQRTEAVSGGTPGRYSPFYCCGYSADISGGCGNLNAGQPYTTCSGNRADCQARGMFATDTHGNATARFGGIEFVPPTTLVRSYGEKGWHLSQALDNEAQYNDSVPMVYGTAWFAPPIVVSKNDGNLTRMEVLLGMGEIDQVLCVLVNDIVIPLGQAGKDMTGTGWFNVITPGTRSGAFDLDYTDAAGNPLGDPYGSMAYLSVVVPNRINNGSSLPNIQVLLQGLHLEQYTAQSSLAAYGFTNNPAWVILDLLRHCGWELADLDLASFANAAEYCAEPISAVDLNGNPISIPRFQCNLVLQDVRSAADVIRGVRNGSRLFLTYSITGLLQIGVENTIALQQPTQAASSNSQSPLNGGWPKYEFGDGSACPSAILRKANGEPSINLSCKSTAETPNRITIEFQDAFNEYQQDSLSLTEVDDALAAGQVVSVALRALGIPNFDQAARIARYQLDKATTGNTYVTFDTSVKGVGIQTGDLITLTYLKEGFVRQLFRVVKVAPGTNYRTVTITAQIHNDGWYSDQNAQSIGNSSVGRQQASNIGTPRPLTGVTIDANGYQQFGITETDIVVSDGSSNTILTVSFVPPPMPLMGAAGIPIVSMAVEIGTAGGTLGGNQSLYYAVSALDSLGEESPLSFVLRATIPAGTNTNTVTLGGLSFSSNTTGFNVYRGATPTTLLRIASSQAVAVSFTDNGLATVETPPPDANYDHANFYWRLELLPETAATVYASGEIGNAGLGMTPNLYQNMTMWITRGTGAGQERSIVSNTATTIMVTPNWTVVPDATSYFVIAENGWQFSARSASSPVSIQAPTRVGETVDISGLSANVYDDECGVEESPLTRWRITGGGGALDSDVPPAPVFGIAASRGNVELAAIAFSTLTNTTTISSGTLIVNYWNELASPSTLSLSQQISAIDTSISLSRSGSAIPGSLIQIDGEILTVDAVLKGGTQYQVERGTQGSSAAAHITQTPIYQLSSKIFIVPFSRDYFGSPSSGNFSYSLALPDVRIASAGLFMTNALGNSPTTANCYTGTADGGLRTLSGGQYSIEVSGYLAVETNAAPALIVEDSHSVRDISAYVVDAPTEAPVTLDLRQGNSIYCKLTVPAGSNYSNVITGFGLPPLIAESALEMDITSVSNDPTGTPGQDLTLTIRL